MASHGSWYARLGCDVRAHYEDVAVELRSKRVDELAAQVSDQIVLIRALRREVDQQEHSSTIPAFSKCKLDPHSTGRCLVHVQAVSQSSRPYAGKARVVLLQLQGHICHADGCWS